MPRLRHAARPCERGAAGAARARLHRAPDRPAASRRTRSSRRSWRSSATACSPCPATRATTTSATCSCTWFPALGILLAAGGHRLRRGALAAPRRRARSAPRRGPRRRGRLPARGRHGALRPVIAQESVDATVFAAFAVGFISFVSPCVLPLVPGYLSTISGVSFADIQEGRGRRQVLGPALLFCLAFTAMFVALGMTATGLGQTLQDNRALLRQISGRGDRPARRAVHRHAVRAEAEPRVAARGADAPRPHRRADHRRARVRRGLAALHRPHARRDPHGRLERVDRRPRAASCSPSTRSASPCRSS